MRLPSLLLPTAAGALAALAACGGGTDPDLDAGGPEPLPGESLRATTLVSEMTVAGA